MQQEINADIQPQAGLCSEVGFDARKQHMYKQISDTWYFSCGLVWNVRWLFLSSGLALMEM